MEDLNDFYYFAEVAQRGGFSAAARALRIPKSRLSRRIADLESRLGVRLLQRSTRQLHLTAIGEDFLRHCQAMVVEAQAAQERIELGVGEARGRIRVSCPALLAQLQLRPILPAFLETHPRVALELEVTNRRVDVVAEGYDIAIRARTPPLSDGDLVAKPLGIARRRIVASPALIASGAPIRAPEDLARFPSLALSAPDGRHLWRLVDGKGREVALEHTPRLVTDDMIALCSIAESGLGVVLLPETVSGEALARGSLVAPLDGWEAPHDVIYAAYVSRRRNLPAVQAFLDFLGREMRPLLRQADVRAEWTLPASRSSLDEA